MSKLISYDVATRLLLENIPAQRTETVPLARSQGRVSAREVTADEDVPPFDRSVMDGYAIRSSDAAKAGSALDLVGEVSAGRVGDFVLAGGEAAAIMTGAPLPSGADAVVMVEKTRRSADSKVCLQTAVRTGENVALRGSEVKHGEIVVSRGQVIGPAQLGVLAMFGRTDVEVLKPPRVGILPTGSEVIEIAGTPAMGQIRNANGPMLAGQSRRLGLQAKELSIVGDDVGALRLAVQDALEGLDILILTGGVSMGKHDYVPQVLREVGVRVIFHKLAIKPGKPVLCGRVGEKLVFGLPGNPVSSFVTYELLVRPAILRWMGFDSVFLPGVTASLVTGFEHRSRRAFYVPGLVSVRKEGLVVRPIRTAGSADLVAFSRSNCLIALPEMCQHVDAGTSVKVLLFGELNDKVNEHEI